MYFRTLFIVLVAHIKIIILSLSIPNMIIEKSSYSKITNKNIQINGNELKIRSIKIFPQVQFNNQYNNSLSSVISLKQNNEFHETLHTNIYNYNANKGLKSELKIIQDDVFEIIQGANIYHQEEFSYIDHDVNFRKPQFNKNDTSYDYNPQVTIDTTEKSKVIIKLIEESCVKNDFPVKLLESNVSETVEIKLFISRSGIVEHAKILHSSNNIFFDRLVLKWYTRCKFEILNNFENLEKFEVMVVFLRKVLDK